MPPASPLSSHINPCADTQHESKMAFKRKRAATLTKAPKRAKHKHPTKRPCGPTTSCVNKQPWTNRSPKGKTGYGARGVNSQRSSAGRGSKDTPTKQARSPLTKEARGSGILRSMRAPLGSDRRWRNVCLQMEPGADLVEDIDSAGKMPAFLCYPLLNIFAVSPHLHPLLNNPTKVYVESISVKAQLRATCSVQYRTMVASGPTALVSASFNGCPPDDHISRGIVTIEHPATEASL